MQSKESFITAADGSDPSALFSARVLTFQLLHVHGQLEATGLLRECEPAAYPALRRRVLQQDACVTSLLGDGRRGQHRQQLKSLVRALLRPQHAVWLVTHVTKIRGWDVSNAVWFFGRVEQLNNSWTREKCAQ